MRNAILFSLIGVIVISLITIGAAYALPRETLPQSSDATLSEQLQNKPETPDREKYPYLLRTYEGKLAVFTSDLVHPDMVFDVYVRTLPEYDREQLEHGVRVENYDRLTSLIEDYIS